MLARIWQKAAKTKVPFFTLATLFVTVFVFPNQGHAQGDLLIFPKRVVFDGQKKTQELNLANTGRDTARYLISVVQIRMKEDGKFENIALPDSGQNFADKYFRFFPRSVTLAPNEAQMVKVQLVKTNEMLPGEYRSHIYFRAEREKRPLGEEDLIKDSTSITVSLTPIFGISIPLIIKVGASTAKITVSDMGLTLINDTIPALKVKFNRSGNMSTYGDITINHIAPNGKVNAIGSIQGVAVYTPTPTRFFTIALDKSKGVNLRAGKLQLVYTDQTPKKNIMAQQELVLAENMMATLQ
jgi:hypothetical protein